MNIRRKPFAVNNPESLKCIVLNDLVRDKIRQYLRSWCVQSRPRTAGSFGTFVENRGLDFPRADTGEIRMAAEPSRRGYYVSQLTNIILLNLHVGYAWPSLVQFGSSGLGRCSGLFIVFRRVRRSLLWGSGIDYVNTENLIALSAREKVRVSGCRYTRFPDFKQHAWRFSSLIHGNDRVVKFTSSRELRLRVSWAILRRGIFGVGHSPIWDTRPSWREKTNGRFVITLFLPSVESVRSVRWLTIWFYGDSAFGDSSIK